MKTLLTYCSVEPVVESPPAAAAHDDLDTAE